MMGCSVTAWSHFVPHGQAGFPRAKHAPLLYGMRVPHASLAHLIRACVHEGLHEMNEGMRCMMSMSDARQAVWPGSGDLAKGFKRGSDGRGWTFQGRMIDSQAPVARQGSAIHANAASTGSNSDRR